MPQEFSPEFWVNFAATVFFAGTVGLMLWDIRYQKKGLRQDAYEALRDDHAEIVKLQLENSDPLDEIWKNIDKPANVDETKWTSKERKIFLFYVLIFDLYERIHWQITHGEISKDKEEGEEEWKYWLEWLSKINKHWLFKYTFDSVNTAYEDAFNKSITEKFFLQK